MTEKEVLEQFDDIYQNDPELRQLLGAFPDEYSLEDKCSIVQAYRKGGGVQGLHEIIDDDEEEEDEQDQQEMVINQ